MNYHEILDSFYHEKYIINTGNLNEARMDFAKFLNNKGYLDDAAFQMWMSVNNVRAVCFGFPVVFAYHCDSVESAKINDDSASIIPEEVFNAIKLLKGNTSFSSRMDAEIAIKQALEHIKYKYTWKNGPNRCKKDWKKDWSF